MALRVGAIAYTHYESDPRVRREAEILAARGDDVTVWCLQAEGRPPVELQNGVKICRITLPRYRGGRAVSYVGSYAGFFALAGARLAAEHFKQRLDIVHVHTMPDFLVFASLLPRISGARVVLDMHDLMPDLFALKFGGKRGGLAVKALHAVQRAATTFADAVICVHEPQYRLLLRDGVPARKLAIVMNAADPQLFPKRDVQPKFAEGQPIELIYHGTVLHRFGVDIAIRAFAEARKSEPRLRFSILGDGDFVPDARRLAQELGLGPDAIEISGQRVPLDAIAARIRGAHLGIAPNRDDQEDSVLPNKLLEYVAVGIPTVAAGTRCIRRYFDERQLELVPPEDVGAMAQAILRLCNDGARRKDLAAAAADWQAEYGFETQKRLLCRTLDALVPPPPKAAKPAAAEADKAEAKPQPEKAEKDEAPKQEAKPKQPKQPKAPKPPRPPKPEGAQGKKNGAPESEPTAEKVTAEKSEAQAVPAPGPTNGKASGPNGHPSSRAH